MLLGCDPVSAVHVGSHMSFLDTLCRYLACGWQAYNHNHHFDRQMSHKTQSSNLLGGWRLAANDGLDRRMICLSLMVALCMQIYAVGHQHLLDTSALLDPVLLQGQA